MEPSQASSPSHVTTDGPWGRAGLAGSEESIKLIPKIRPSTTPGLPDYVQYVGHKALALAAPGAENALWDFDFVASPHTRQSSFFRVAGRPMADHFLAFYNAAVIAYGQTGSGKTHTMLGTLPPARGSRGGATGAGVLDDMPREAGLIPRILDYIFQRIAAESAAPGAASNAAAHPHGPCSAAAASKQQQQQQPQQSDTATKPARVPAAPPPGPLSPLPAGFSTPGGDCTRTRRRSGIPTPNGVPRNPCYTPPPASPVELGAGPVQGPPGGGCGGGSASGPGSRSKGAGGGNGGTTTMYLVKASMLQIYQEVVTDLLNPRPVRLQLRETMQGGVTVVGLSEVTIRSASEALQLLRVGTSHRAVAETASNPVSSRSHCILTLHMEAKDTLEAGVVRIRRSRLQLVDLAGSERTSKGADYASTRQKEANAINKSLSTLCLVIARLSDRTRSQGPVPYRDSKLTFLLQDCLGGNAKTLIIANLNPSPNCSGETNMTLGFALRAKRVRNRAVVNEDRQGDAVVLQGEVRRLREELSIFRTLHAEDAPPKGLQQLSAWRDQAAARAAELHHAMELNTELEDKLAALEAAHARLRSDHAALEEQCEAQRNEMSALEATVEQCEDELMELRARPSAERYRALEQQLLATARERDEAATQLRNLATEHSRLRGEYEELASVARQALGVQQASGSTGAGAPLISIAGVDVGAGNVSKASAAAAVIAAPVSGLRGDQDDLQCDDLDGDVRRRGGKAGTAAAAAATQELLAKTGSGQHQQPQHQQPQQLLEEQGSDTAAAADTTTKGLTAAAASGLAQLQRLAASEDAGRRFRALEDAHAALLAEHRRVVAELAAANAALASYDGTAAPQAHGQGPQHQRRTHAWQNNHNHSRGGGGGHHHQHQAMSGCSAAGLAAVLESPGELDDLLMEQQGAAWAAAAVSGTGGDGGGGGRRGAVSGQQQGGPITFTPTAITTTYGGAAPLPASPSAQVRFASPASPGDSPRGPAASASWVSAARLGSQTSYSQTSSALSPLPYSVYGAAAAVYVPRGRRHRSRAVSDITTDADAAAVSAAAAADVRRSEAALATLLQQQQHLRLHDGPLDSGRSYSSAPPTFGAQGDTGRSGGRDGGADGAYSYGGYGVAVVGQRRRFTADELIFEASGGLDASVLGTASRRARVVSVDEAPDDDARSLGTCMRVNPLFDCGRQHSSGVGVGGGRCSDADLQAGLESPRSVNNKGNNGSAREDEGPSAAVVGGMRTVAAALSRRMVSAGSVRGGPLASDSLVCELPMPPHDSQLASTVAAAVAAATATLLTPPSVNAVAADAGAFGGAWGRVRGREESWNGESVADSSAGPAEDPWLGAGAHALATGAAATGSQALARLQQPDYSEEVAAVDQREADKPPRPRRCASAAGASVVKADLIAAAFVCNNPLAAAEEEGEAAEGQLAAVMERELTPCSNRPLPPLGLPRTLGGAALPRASAGAAADLAGPGAQAPSSPGSPRGLLAAECCGSSGGAAAAVAAAAARVAAAAATTTADGFGYDGVCHGGGGGEQATVAAAAGQPPYTSTVPAAAALPPRAVSTPMLAASPAAAGPGMSLRLETTPKAATATALATTTTNDAGVDLLPPPPPPQQPAAAAAGSAQKLVRSSLSRPGSASGRTSMGGWGGGGGGLAGSVARTRGSMVEESENERAMRAEAEMFRQQVLVENVAQLEDELARRLQGETQLRRELQMAIAEAQHASLQMQVLVQLNSALVDDLSQRDERLRGFEELVARLYGELKSVVRQVLQDAGGSNVPDTRLAAGSSRRRAAPAGAAPDFPLAPPSATSAPGKESTAAADADATRIAAAGAGSPGVPPLGGVASPSASPHVRRSAAAGAAAAGGPGSPNPATRLLFTTAMDLPSEDPADSRPASGRSPSRGFGGGNGGADGLEALLLLHGSPGARSSVSCSGRRSALGGALAGGSPAGGSLAEALAAGSPARSMIMAGALAVGSPAASVLAAALAGISPARSVSFPLRSPGGASGGGGGSRSASARGSAGGVDSERATSVMAGGLVRLMAALRNGLADRVHHVAQLEAQLAEARSRLRAIEQQLGPEADSAAALLRRSAPVIGRQGAAGHKERAFGKGGKGLRSFLEPLPGTSRRAAAAADGLLEDVDGGDGYADGTDPGIACSHSYGHSYGGAWGSSQATSAAGVAASREGLEGLGLGLDLGPAGEEVDVDDAEEEGAEVEGEGPAGEVGLGMGMLLRASQADSSGSNGGAEGTSFGASGDGDDGDGSCGGDGGAESPGPGSDDFLTSYCPLTVRSSLTSSDSGAVPSPGNHHNQHANHHRHHYFPNHPNHHFVVEPSAPMLPPDALLDSASHLPPPAANPTTASNPRVSTAGTLAPPATTSHLAGTTTTTTTVIPAVAVHHRSSIDSALQLREASLQAQIQSREQQVLELLERTEELEAALQAARTEHDARVAELQAAANRLAASLQAQLCSRDTQIAELQSQAAEMDGQLRAAASEAARCRQQAADAAARAERSGGELRTIEVREQMLLGKLKQLEASLARRGEEVAALREELAGAAEQLAGMRAQAVAAQVEAAAARQSAAALREVLEDLRSGGSGGAGSGIGGESRNGSFTTQQLRPLAPDFNPGFFPHPQTQHPQQQRQQHQQLLTRQVQQGSGPDAPPELHNVPPAQGGFPADLLPPPPPPPPPPLQQSQQHYHQHHHLPAHYYSFPPFHHHAGGGPPVRLVGSTGGAPLDGCAHWGQAPAGAGNAAAMAHGSFGGGGSGGGSRSEGGAAPVDGHPLAYDLGWAHHMDAGREHATLPPHYLGAPAFPGGGGPGAGPSPGAGGPGGFVMGMGLGLPAMSQGHQRPLGRSSRGAHSYGGAGPAAGGAKAGGAMAYGRGGAGSRSVGGAPPPGHDHGGNGGGGGGGNNHHHHNKGTWVQRFLCRKGVSADGSPAAPQVVTTILTPAKWRPGKGGMTGIVLRQWAPSAAAAANANAANGNAGAGGPGHTNANPRKAGQQH